MKAHILTAARSARLGRAVMALAALGLAAAPAAQAAPTTFVYTGYEQSYVVPAGVTSVHMDLTGSRGGRLPGAGSGAGGFGAQITADMPVNPGQTLFIEVGGFYYGAIKYDGDGGQPIGGGGAAGGAASDVRTCSLGAATCPGGESTLDTRVIVAGGGGGGGASTGGVFGGTGGAGAGGSGGNIFSGGPGNLGGGVINGAAGGDGTGGSGGGGGTGTQAGGGGSGVTGSGTEDGGDGQLGSGGRGGYGGSGTGGGGGGGGFFGGGGGAGGLDAGRTGSGGGAGASFISSRATIGTYQTDNTGNPQHVTITPGPVDTSPPAAAVTTPADGTTYAQGQIVDSSYYCTDLDGEANISSCAGPAPWGSAIDTSAIGAHAFTVTATDRAGNTGTTTTHYTVLAPAGGGRVPPPGPGITPVPRPAPAPLPGPGARPKPAPILTALSETSAVFAPARRPTPLVASTARARHRRGTTFRVGLNEAATLTIVVEAKLHGVRVGRRCQRSRRRGRRCAVYRTVITLKRVGHSGSKPIAFSGRVQGRALTPGRYRATFTASAAGQHSTTRTLAFTIVPR
jgi:hypothetical protein